MVSRDERFPMEVALRLSWNSSLEGPLFLDMDANVVEPIEVEQEYQGGDVYGALWVMDNPIDTAEKPFIGMQFDQDNEAYEFYNSYRGRLGFSVRKDYINKSKKDKNVTTSRRFVCSKQGIRSKDKRVDDASNSRAETRTNCAARMGIILLKIGKYECQDFVEEHNHELHLASTTHMMRSQRIISDVHASEIELADNSGIRPKPFFEFMGNQAGGRQSLGYTRADHYNYLRTKHQRDLKYGEPGSLLRGVVIFGAALLYDETVESFKWLLETFLESHEKKKPITIFTDQDAALASAISKVLPETCHGLCTWHLMQNGIKHLGNLMKDGSSFLSDLKKCIYQYGEEEQFENSWEQLRFDYQVENGPWLDRIFGLKHKWARCYMKNTFTGGMRSTQLSESINADLKDYTKCTLDIVQFFKHFELVVNDKHANELKAKFDSRNKLPKNAYKHTPIMVHASKVYTPLKFDLFHDEYE
ncbi:protein FAR1-RELATED SEQUENCE 5-like [Telopea speciosissima]|uniref:protein FAR1-RELATED SEQUENCE 5-like n=1 Tax=Telopea speciosissima TaxID=54955 RepID=UPI001CC34220|nr:protein FAR1-RELATED SEQUENCE 5-like [Telopea speciosissima]